MIKIINKAEIITKEINYQYEDNVSNSDADDQKEMIGKYPTIFLNGVQIENKDIEKFILFNDSTYPEIELIFKDPTSKLFEDFPVDNTIISIFKKSKGGLISNGDRYNVKDIKMDFKISKFTPIKGDANNVKFKLIGILDVDELYLFNFESYNSSTYDLLKQLSSEMKLGFSSNIESTNDEMNWINPGNQRKDFMREIIKKSYIDDTTYLFGYIDFYYQYNYVDINKQLNSDINDQQIIDITNDYDPKVKDETESRPLILTNKPDNKSSSLFISKYTINSNSTDININIGYRYRYSSYNKSEDNFSRYKLDSISDDNNGGIILKGNPFTDNNLLYEESIDDEWMGKIDLDNVHNKFLHCELQNKNNLKFLQKLKITIRLDEPNFALYRFQLVRMELYDLTRMNDSSDNTVTDDKDKHEYDSKIIHRLSGDWLITAIKFYYTKKDSNYQEVTLVKRELTEEYTFPDRKKSN